MNTATIGNKSNSSSKESLGKFLILKIGNSTSKSIDSNFCDLYRFLEIHNQVINSS